ncbi:hypothetical protein M2146_001190 [Lachnospiraceae bacterium PF1-22]
MSCSFLMLIKGEMKNILSFISSLEQHDDDIWIGQGANVQSQTFSCSGKYKPYFEVASFRYYEISGHVQEGLHLSLTEFSYKMQNRKEPYVAVGHEIQFLTLQEACSKWKLEIEVFAEGTTKLGTLFDEYVLCNDSQYHREKIDVKEYKLDSYSTKEVAEQSLGLRIPQDAWDKRQYRNNGFARIFSI